MTTPVLFDKNAPDQINEVPDLDQLYNDLVGEGKKYQDPKVVLKSKLDSDEHIKRIERENAELRADLQARLSIEEAISKMSKPSNDEVNKPVTERTDTQMTPETIQEIIDRELAKRTNQSQVQQNQKKVVDKLVEVWGDSYSTRLKARAKELQLGEEFLADLASKQPDAFLKIIDPKPVAGAPSLGHPQSTRVGALGSNEKTWAYYNKMRRENPSLYHSITTQREIHSQAAKLGEAFYK